MQEDIITIKNLKKEFKVNLKGREGFIGSLQHLFMRKSSIITAVENISMNIKKGEIRALIGPNGSGKSTTIKILSGILYPTSGYVNVMGYTPWEHRMTYVQKIGVVMGQKSQLLWDLPPLDTFALNREIYKVPRKSYKETLDYFIELLDLSEIIKRPVRQLSLGERMKCELVCAMLHSPSLVYLDEPTIGLDIFAKESIRKFIKQINLDKKVTFILTTHDLEEVENICQNITIINRGMVVYKDSINNLKSIIANKRIVDVKFSEKTEREKLQDFSILDFHPLKARIEVDLSKNNIQDIVYRLFKAVPCQDLNIESIGIEEVIKQIYSN